MRARFGAIALAVAAGGCADLVAGDAQDVVPALCQVVSDCEPVDPSCALFDQRFRTADDPDVTSQFLEHHARNDCLASCSSARGCRDRAPLCLENGLACDDDVDCCGSTRGTGACRQGACCAPLGAPCGTGGDCCGGELCVDGHCGDERCALVGDGCTRNTDCCSRLCTGGACDAKTCSDFSESCLVDADCCPTGGEPLVCRDAICQNPPAACNACVPVGDPALNCCLDQGELCFVRVDGTSFCDPDLACSPPGVECGSNSDCCGGMCEDSFFPHCCQPVGAPCSVDIECCGGALCSGGACL